MYAVGGVLGAFASPFFGKLVDRYGSRSCLPFGFLGLCLAMQVLSHATNAPMVMVGFFMSRLFSIGALNPWCQVTLNQVPPTAPNRPPTHCQHHRPRLLACCALQWFDRERGRVMGTMMVITTFIRSGPYAVAYENAIEVFGWRTTQQYGSVSCLILAVPVVLLIFYRVRQPSQTFSVCQRSDTVPYTDAACWFGSRRMWVACPTVPSRRSARV